MHPPQTNVARASSRLAMRNPERLWLHYSFAIALFFGLILATYWVNGTMIERGVLASEGVEKSNEQVLLAQEIVGLATMRQDVPSEQLTEVIGQFEAINWSLAVHHSRSEALWAHFFETDQQLFQRVSLFTDIARKIAEGPADNAQQNLARLQDLYTDGGLESDLRKTVELFRAQVALEASQFATLRSMLLWASILVLMAEVIFVFWPAHHAVRTTLDKMRRQTSVLRASQTRLKEMNGQLERMVLHDPLTGLPNRKSLVNFLDAGIMRGAAAGWQLYLVGLDGFKTINDSIGHEKGDLLLVKISRTLQRCVDYDDIVAHVGGDTFVLISGEEKSAVLQRLVKALKEPFTIAGRNIPIMASIGYLAIGPKLRKPLDIVADAEIALSAAKLAGGNRAVEFTKDLRDELGQMQELQVELREAIMTGQIEPWFQPQIRLKDGNLHGVEVLARWRHPRLGLLTPDKFLPAAVSAGLMVDLDHAVWRAAMGFAIDWQTKNIWRPVISLNAAPETISDPNLIERFLLAVKRSGLSSDQVIVEVLETTLINGKDDMAAINIDTLAESGIALELDDFGTGYASLSKLTQLPLAGIKLDRSLVSPLPSHAADSVVRAILALAAELGLHVIAEGVEETAQADHLCHRGCCIGQGYGFGRPMPADEFAAWLQKNAIRIPKDGHTQHWA